MTVMTVEEAIAKIEEEKIFYHDGESDLCALCEAWQTLKTAVLAQRTNNKQSTPCHWCDGVHPMLNHAYCSNCGRKL